MRYLVVGATGFIGQHVTAALARRGVEWTGIGHQAATSAEVVVGDFVNPRTYEHLLNADVVVLLYGSTRPGSPANTLTHEVENNVLAHARFVEALERSAVKHVIYMSSGGTVYGEQQTSEPIDEGHPIRPISFYGMGKVLVEEVLRLGLGGTGIKLTVLRPGNPVGAHQAIGRVGVVASAVQAIRSGEPLTVWGDGTNVRDFFDVEDLANAVIVASTESSGGTFNVGSGKGRSIREVLDLVQSLSGRSLRVEYLPDRGVDVKRNVLSPARINSAMGWAPTHDLPDLINVMLRGNAA